MPANRYKVERESGSDFKIVDTSQNNQAVATGLDEDEAQTTADQWNRDNEQQAKNFIESA